MENQQQQGTGQQTGSEGKGLGIAALVLGIIAVVLSFVPCLGMYAMFPGVIGVVLGAISMNQASKTGAARGMAIAGLVCGILGVIIAYTQYHAVQKAGQTLHEISNELKMDIEKIK